MKATKIILGIIAVLFLGFLAIDYFLGNQIRLTHTMFLFNQFGDHDEGYSSLHRDSAKWEEFDDEEYLKFTRIQEKRNIDWNSCSIVDGKILDGWGQACRVEYKKGSSYIEYRFSSAGRDGIWSSDNDVVKAYKNGELVSRSTLQRQ